MSELHDKKKALLARLLAKEGLRRPAHLRIAPRSTNDPAPLSFAQRRLWLLEEMALSGPPAYNMSAAYLLDGDLDADALQRAFDQLVERHEILRTRIAAINGEPRQVVDNNTRVQIARSDLSTKADPLAAFTNLAESLAETRFNLSAAPLVRVSVARLSHSQHGLAVVLHHIVADGWSLPILMREVMAAYSDARNGRVSSLAPLTLQYADYAVWHRGVLESKDAETHRGYWTNLFADLPPTLELPVDRPRRSERSFHGADVRLRMDNTVVDGLKRVSQAQGASVFMTLIACVNVVIARYSGQRDLVIGTPMAGRMRGELADQIGFYVNMLPLRTPIDAAEPFTSLIGRVSRNIGAALEHEIYPFDQLVHDLHLDRDLARSPLFDVVVVVDKAGDAVLDFEGLRVQPLDLPRTSSKFDLTCHFVEFDDHLDLAIEYSTDLFDRPRIERLAAHIEQLIRAAVTAPDTLVGELPLLPAREREQILEWGRAKSPAAIAAPLVSVIDRFEEHARTRPDAVAASFDGKHISYGALNAHANRIARRLKQAGAGVESRVGICTERSLELVAAILGVLKAGAAYVPLDPSYPADRLKYLIDDSGMSIVLTHGANAEARLGDWAGISLRIDDDDASAESGNVGRATSPEQTAYVIYTSGSTGQPKGCVVTHGNLSRLMTATDDWYHFDERDVWTLFHSYAFDFSVWEIWGALAYGGRLVVVPYWISRAPDAFLQLLSTERVTVLNQTPSAFRELIRADAAAPQDLSLRYVVFGGEALDIPALEPWFRARGDRSPQLVNMYGITETTVHVTYRPVSLKDSARGSGSVIGEPIPDLSFYLLDELLEPVPVGVSGEIYVGGAGVCRGYLNRPALTAERFVPDPFSPLPGARLYRSGDVARWTAAGDVEYIGRADTQIKIRGFRIEVGEIEAAIRAQHGVADAVVIAREHAGAKQLVAYVVTNTGIETSSLRAPLETSLPDYMVPAHVVRIDALPLTPNGKLDVRALPEPEGGTQAVFAEPRTDAERVLADIWAEALGVARVGIDDNYFELGGDSILALRVIASARERDVPFGIRDLYQRRTIRALLSSPEDTTATAIAASALEPFALINDGDRALLPAEVEDAYPLSRLQAGMFFHSALDPESAVFHDIFSYRLKLRFDASAFRAAATALAHRHPALRTSFHWEPFSEPLQLVAKSADVPVAINDLRPSPPDEHDVVIAAWLESEKRQRFNPSQAPLFKLTVHVRSDDELQLTADFHHAILDGWSFATLMAELVSQYLDALSGIASAIAAPQGRFSDFIALERTATDSDASRRFWATQVNQLPATRIPRSPAHNTHGAASAEVEIANGAQLQSLAQQLGVPVKNVCMAAHAAVLAVISGDDDIVTGLTTNGRPDSAGAEHVVGLFLNTVPFRLKLGRDSWRTVIEHGFAAERELLEHRRFPLSDIKALAGGRELYDAGFNFVHFHVYKSIGERVGLIDLIAFEQTDYSFVANFSIDPRDNRLALRLSYDAAQFSREHIELIAGYYARALQLLAAAPDASWREAALLNASERNSAERALARGPETPAPNWNVVSRFDAHASATPDAIAVVFGDRSVTYRELNRRANAVAAHLHSIGIGADDLTAIHMPRSEWLVAALLGTLKAGAAYVPIDVSYPADRIAYVLSDSGARVVLSDGSADGVDVTALGTVEVFQTPSLSSDQLAYVIYTSGSTGRPKGTMISHAGLAHYLAWAIDEYHVDGRSRSIVHSSVSFDATITSLLAPLLAGGTVELVPEEHAVLSLAQALKTNQSYAVVKITPAHLDLLRHELGGRPTAHVGAFVIGGEALLDATLAWWRTASPQSRFLNEYGPTETVVGCAIFEDRGGSGGAVPIGRPIDRMRMYVLDADLKSVPTGTQGEIFIGGAGVARGYLARPDLTAERFVPDPFGPPGARMYRTGDLARWNFDDQLEYLGRNDDQIKVRGHRVELREIEAVLSEHPEVTEAAVVARAVNNTHELIAFVVASSTTLESLRQFLTKRLPEPLIPSRFAVVDAMPLTPNGKIDRRALLARGGDALQSSRPFVAPNTETERALAAIWESVLRKDRVGATDDYFASGGDSLKALQVVSRASRAGWKLRVRDVFDFPTIAELAHHTSREIASAEQGAVVGAVALTPIQHWLFDEHAGPYHHFNQSVSLRWRGRVDASALSRALTALVSHHDALRMQFTRPGNAWHQHSPAPGIVVDVIDNAQSADIDRLQQSFDLAQGRLVGAAIIRGAADRVIVAIHHLVVDGVSWRVLLEDLDTVYRQIANGSTVQLPQKTESFRAWSDHLAAHAQSTAVQSERSYWNRVAANIAQLPSDGDAQTGEPLIVSVQLDANTTSQILGSAHAAYRTQANDLLLTGLARALESAFDVRGSLITVEGHGRHDDHDGLDIDISRTVGWFTTRYPVRLELSGNDLREQIRATKEQLRSVPARGFGYGLLRYLSTNNDGSSLTCRPSIGFNYLGRFEAESSSQLFEISNDATGAVVPASWTRDHDIEIIATVLGDTLDIRIEGTAGRFTQHRLNTLAASYVDSLTRIAQHCAAASGEPTPADLTYAGLDVRAFDAALAQHGLSADAIEDVLPLSPMQEGFLVHSLSENSGAYFEQSAYRLRGRVDAVLFERAWNQLLSRYPNLRVAFWPDGLSRPAQVVLKHRRVEFRSDDWRAFGVIEQQHKLAAFRTSERQRGFDLTADALVRVALFQVGDDEFDAVWSFPHLLLDGWSAGILLSELLPIYASLVEATTLDLAEPVPYRRYLQWLERQPRAASTEFWSQYLNGYDEAVSVPAERRGARDTYEALSLPWALSVEETAQLKSIAAALHITLSTAVQTLWAALLSSYTERNDVVFGATVSGRPESLSGVERMVGLFINTLPVRVTMSAADSFASLAARVQADNLSAQSHASCPLAEIQAQTPLGPQLFDHILVFENYPLDERLREIGSLIKVESSDVFEQVHYDLGLLVADADQLQLRFIANGRAYPAARLQRIIGHFTELTRAVLANPHAALQRHAIVPTAERRQLDAFNETPAPTRTGATLVDLLNEQAAATPSATALIAGHERMTYAQLHEQSDRIAAVLRSKGASAETLIGVFISRRAELIPALIGVLKSGAAYVPLDPNYPSDRLSFLMNDAHMALVLTERALRPLVPGAEDTVLCVEELSIDVHHAASPTLHPDNLAYVIYTSGSTGQPKGTAISHRAAANLVEWAKHTYTAGELRGVLASTSVCFDLSIFEIFVTLSTGGAVILAENALALPALPAANEVTLVNTVPSAMTELVRANALPASVHTVNLAGEPLKLALVDALYGIPTIERVCDLYGPSEDTTYSTYAQRENGGPETIGGPLTHSHTEIYLLNSRLERTPVGMIGELFIASDKLCRGYLNRPAMTAERFVPNPWSRAAGARMYRTGDLARYREDGQIEFLGRSDHQVKIRGFRIELGEIDAAIKATGWTRDSAVVAREDAPGDKTIAAYIVLNGAEERGANAFREVLAKRLPEYMVPAAFVFLERLPLTPNGKLDRRALPKPDASYASAVEPPRNELESTLVRIWRDALDVDQLGIFDSFFDHGGHSLKAARLISRARHEFGLDVSLRDLFTHPTVAGLAEEIGSRLRIADSPIPTTPAGSSYEVSFGQRRLWVLEQLRGSGPAAYNVPAAFVLHGEINAAALEGAMRTVINRHEVLRTRFVVVNGEPRQEIAPAAQFTLDAADWSRRKHNDQLFDDEVRRMAHLPFDLNQPALLRAGLRKLANDRFGLVIVMHHIATDGWSIPILMRELVAAYRAAVTDAPLDLPPLRVQYKDYALWHRQLINDEAAMAAHRSYWRSVFAELPAPLELPTDRPRTLEQTFDGAQLTLDLSPDTAAAVRAFAAKQGVSLYTALLAGFAALVSRLTNQRDFVFGSPMTGRTHADLSEQIGYYVNTMPLRLQVPRGAAFRDLVNHTRHVVSGAHEHQLYPFDKLVEDLNIERDLSRSPLFDVMVAMDTSDHNTLALEGAAVEPIDFDYRVSKFDVTTTFSERKGGGNIAVVFEYNTALFERASIERIGSRFDTLLRAIVAAPDTAIDLAPVLPIAERAAVVETWNWEALGYERGSSLAALFEAQALAAPSAPAVSFAGATLTYEELDRRANAIAHALISRGAQREEAVGVMVEPSNELIVGLLGILKAGCAYVPLDPHHPRERNELVIADANIRIAVSKTASAFGPHVEFVDVSAARDAGPIARAHDSDEQLAYVIYTSGSTGRPKGVEVTHRGVVNLLADFQRRKQIGIGDRCALWTNATFDVSVYEIFSALTSGGCLCIAAEAMRSQPHAYFEWLAQEHVTSAYVAPFQLGELRDFIAAAPKALSLSRLLVGVEPIEESLLASIQSMQPSLQVINGYGPTEATICATLYDISDTAPARITPIGRAVANTGVFIVDEHLQPVGIGVIGEIVIAGDGLARGYRANAAATAQAFVPSPFSAEPGTRMYRTGDLGRRLPDGSIVFAGRTDHQVKVRGHRIEIGEVERAIRAHSDIADVAVIAQASGTTRELVAFLVACAEPSVESLRAFLHERLPEYMIPSKFVVMHSLPATTNGKIDRRALSIDRGALLRTESLFAAPRTDRERVLADIWKDVLGAERIGVNDNYFALGGDSIKAIQIAARASTHRLSLTIRDVFTHPTVAELARAAGERTRVAPQSLVVGPSPLTAIQQWFFVEHASADAAIEQLSHFNQAVMLRATQPIDAMALAVAANAIVVHHDVLRSRFAINSSGAWTQTFAASSPVSVITEDWRDFSQGDAVLRMERRADEMHTGLDITTGPLLTIGHFRLPDADRVLIVIHHLVVDGVSWRVLFEDLDLAYRQARNDEEIRLPLKTDSFKEWALAMQSAAPRPDIASERPYWEEMCATAPEPLVPAANRSMSSPRQSISARLDISDTRALLSGSRAANGADTTSLLLAGLAAALRASFGRPRTLINLEGHGRETSLADIDVSRTIGWFTSLYPFVLDAGDDGDLRTAIRRVANAMAVIPRRGAGFGVLRYLGENSQALAYSADVGFNYLGDFSRSAGAAQTFEFAAESSGAPIDPLWPNAHALDVSAHVDAGHLSVSLTFDASGIARTHAERLLDIYVASLRQIAAIAGSTSTEVAQLIDRHGIESADVEDLQRLSPMQEGMLFSAQFDANSSAYFEQISYRIRGRVDRDRFEAAWNALLARHPNLRVSIWHKQAASPVAVVRRGRRMEVEYRDWSNDTTDVQRDKLAQYRAFDRTRGFDLERDALMRASLFKTGADTWEVVWSYPHLLLDGWSTAVLLDEFVEIYADRHNTLPAPAQFSTYLDWIAAQDHSAALDRWKQRLDDYETTSSIPSDEPVSEILAAKQHVSWSLPTSDIEAVSSRLGVTLNTMIQALWGVLLGRLTDRTDVVFGATVSGRPESLPNVERMIGLFINTIPVRVRWSESESFASLAQRLQRESVAAQADGFVPLADIQSSSVARSGLFDHLVIFENYPLTELDERVNSDAAADWTMEAVDVFEETHYPLTLAIAPARERVEFRCSYDASTYSAAAIERLAAQFEQLTSAMVVSQNHPLRSASIASPDEQARVLAMGAGAASSFGEETLLALLEERRALSPNAIAVSFGDRQLTFAQLHEAADQVAVNLRAAGVTTDTPVALCLERSIELVIGMLAIVKAGGAYVPIDPDHPAARIAFVLDDARIGVVVTSRNRMASDIAPSVQRVFVEDAAMSASTDTARPLPQSLAYVLYTSGSTGAPKGVGIEHRALANHVRWMAREYPLASSDRVLQKTPFSFDASVWEFWAPLIEGASLVIAAPGAHQDPRLLAETIRSERITVLQLVPTLLHALLDEPRFAECVSLTRVFVGGEALLPALQQKFFAVLPHARLINLYGPTETTIDATSCECRADDTFRSVPIGSAVDGLIAYVFDHRMEFAAVGVWGELCIGGAGVGRGYLSRPDLTAERFIPDPFSTAGARMYRTGDRARWTAAGQLEYGGRSDDQVKLRGFRIELGEIETALRAMPGIHDAAAAVVSNGTELVAFITGDSSVISISGLRSALREAGLPAQMIPSRFVFLESLPKTTSGKLDRRALTLIKRAAESASVASAPRNDHETALAAVWARVLGIAAVGVHDNFFDLGGHSLTAARVAAQASRDLGATVSVRDIFTYPTVAELSAFLTAASWAADSAQRKTNDDTHEDITL